jgi:predicted ATPase/DNA-binding SARP family transcriptional activator
VPVAEVSVRLLGPVRIGSGPHQVGLSGARPRAVLAALAFRHAHAVSTEQLIDDLWADRMPATARNAVQVYASVVRRALDQAGGPVRLESSRGGYILTGTREHIDWHLFESLAAQGRSRRAAGDDVIAGRLFSQALQLWNGTAMADTADVPLAVMVRAQAEAARLAVLGDRIEADLASGRPGLEAELIGLTEEHPLDERFAHQLMRALRRSGRRAESLAHYRRLRRRLVDENGLEPGLPLRELHQRLLAEDDPVSGGPPEGPTRAGDPAAPALTVTQPAEATRPLTRRPPRGELIGRDRDLDVLSAMVANHRQVTLVGPHGAGTSAVLEHLAASGGPLGQMDDVWLLPVDGIREPSRLAAAVVAEAGAHPAQQGKGSDVEQLRAMLLGRSVGLLLDHADHLPAGCLDLVSSPLTDRPGLTVVLTAHRPLGLQGESVYRLAPLALPGPLASDPGELEHVPSVQLFLASARRVLPGMELGPDNAGAVAEVCHLLDGLPLAIELAAPRLRMMSLGELIVRLRDRLEPLNWVRPGAGGPPLRASLQLSWTSLTPDAQQALGRLAFWAGSLSLTAAEALLEDCCASPLDVLHDLVDRFLVMADTGQEETRYRLLNSVRHFVQQQATLESPDHARQRQALYLRGLAARAAQDRRGQRRRLWLDRLTAERPGLEVTLGWCLDHQPGLALQLLASLWWWWNDRPAEGLFWYRKALARTEAYAGPGADSRSAPVTDVIPVDVGRSGSAVSPEARLQALLGAAVVASLVHPVEALDYAHSARRLATRAGTTLERIRAEQHLADIAYDLGDLDLAQEHGSIALALAREHGPPYALGRCLLTAAYNGLGALDLDAAGEHASAALMVFRRMDDAAGMADAQLVITEVAVTKAGGSAPGRPPLAQAGLASARTAATFRREHSTRQLARALVQRAWCSDEVDDPGGHLRAAWLHEAFTLHTQIGHHWSIARDLEFVAQLCVSAGAHVRAAVLLAAADSLRAETGASALPRDTALRAPLIAECVRHLGMSAFRVASALGTACDLPAAVSEVLTLAPHEVSTSGALVR